MNVAQMREYLTRLYGRGWVRDKSDGQIAAIYQRHISKKENK